MSIKKSVKGLLRFMKKNPDLVNMLKNLNIQKSTSTETLIKILADLKNLAQTKLTTPQ
jgi:hypothetical protein